MYVWLHVHVLDCTRETTVSICDRQCQPKEYKQGHVTQLITGDKHRKKFMIQY